MIVHFSSDFVFLQSKRSVFMFLKQKYLVVDKRPLIIVLDKDNEERPQSLRPLFESFLFRKSGKTMKLNLFHQRHPYVQHIQR